MSVRLPVPRVSVNEEAAPSFNRAFMIVVRMGQRVSAKVVAEECVNRAGRPTNDTVVVSVKCCTGESPKDEWVSVLEQIKRCFVFSFYVYSRWHISFPSSLLAVMRYLTST